MDTNFKPGLEGVVAAQTRLSSVDGLAGKLIVSGFTLEELAGNATFEEAVYLLWHDALPTGSQLTEFRQQLAVQRALPEVTLSLLRAAASQGVQLMDALRMAADTLSLGRPEAANVDGAAMRLLASFPVIVAAYWRILNGQEPLTPRADFGQAANYLYMLFGSEPSPEQVRALETYLNTVIDHGLNASTFTARVIISTESDLISAVVGAVGALKGPLHGGAPGPALQMVEEIGEASKAEAYIRARLERRERLMGFGHRVYKVRDPRAEVLSVAAERLFRNGGDLKLYELARAVEKTAIALLAEYKPGRNLQTNVEFYTALVLQGIGLPVELFTPTFAVSRVAGWIAHCFEQQQSGRLIRPQSVYIGSNGHKWTPVEAR